MLHHIENEYLIASIESVGAEIRSLRNKATGEEYIWPMDTAVWASSSPVLFPAIGKIKWDVIHHEGQAYKMPKHGIIRHHKELKFRQYNEASCGFALESNRETRVQFPFEFHFEVRYTLEGKGLKIDFHISNQGMTPMPFICGGHTAYLCSLLDGHRLEEYYIEFPRERTELEAATLAESGLLGSKQRLFSTPDGRLQLSNRLFNEDALIFADIQVNQVSLGHVNRGKILSVDFTGFSHLALWSKPGADYICIEPWSGLPDHEDDPLEVNLKPSHQTLAPGEGMRYRIHSVIA